MKTVYDIIRKPLFTERTTHLQEKENAYTFEVAKDCNKIEVKQAVEKIFNVKVKKVNISNYEGKMKRLGRFEGRRSSWKKAIVFLADDHKIDFYENV